MKYDEFKQLCKKSWENESVYFCVDRTKKTDQGRHRICKESKKTYTECTPEANSFHVFQTIYG